MVGQTLRVVLALTIFLLGSAGGQEELEGSLPLVSLPLLERVVVDGDLSEWDGRAPLRLCHKNQLIRSGGTALSVDWGGEDDVSAVFYLRHTREALYIAGEVRDDDTHLRDVHWWNGDAVEVFFDTDREGDRQDNTFSDDDYQIFLMPYNPGRPWGVCFQGRRSILGDSDFVGVEVGYRPVDGGYSFEAVFPFVNFPHFDIARGNLGFNLAITDHDRMAGGKTRHNYMTLNGKGRVYLFPRNMCRLELRGSPLLGRSGDVDGGGGATVGLLLTVVLSLLGILAVTFFSVKFYNAAQKYFPRWRTWGVALFFFFMLVVLFLPVGIVRWSTAGVQSRLEECALPLPAILGELCSPDLNQGRGGIRTAGAIKGVLTGDRVPIFDDYDFRIVDLGCDRAVTVSDSGIPFLDYGFPIREKQDYVFPCRGEPSLFRIAFCLRSLFKSPLAQGVAPEGVIDDALEVRVRFTDGLERRLEPLDLYDGATEGAFLAESPCSRAWTRGGYHWHQHVVDLPPEVAGIGIRSVSVRLVNPNVSVDLAGVTGLALDPTLPPLLFFLGTRTLTGVPTWLRQGPTPPGCLRVIGSSSEGGRGEAGAFFFSIPGPADVLFLVYASKDRTLFDKEKYGAELARVLLRYADGTEESETILAGVHLVQWTRDHPEAMESDIAYQWTADGEKRHFTILRIDLDRSSPLQGVSLVNTDSDGSPLLLCAATTGLRVERNDLASGLLREDEGGLSVAPNVLGGARRLVLTLFEDGLAAASSHAPEIAGRLIGTPIPDDARPFVPDSDLTLSDPCLYQAGGKQFLGVYIGLPAEDGGRFLVRCALEMEEAMDAGEVQKTLFLVALFLFLPFFIMFFVDLLGRITMIRLKMSSLFILTSVVPIVFLSLLMFNHLGSLRDDQIRGHLLETVRKGNERLDRFVTDAETAGKAVLNSSDLLDMVELGGSVGFVDDELIASFLRDWLDEVMPDDGIERAARLEIELAEGERGQIFSSAEYDGSSVFDDTESGLCFHWGKLFYMGTSEREESPRLRLSVGGIVTPRFLENLAGELDCDGLVVTEAGTGYPVVASVTAEEDIAERRRRQTLVNQWLDERKETFLGEKGGDVLLAVDLLPARGNDLVLEAQKTRKGFLVPVSVFLTQVEVEDFFLLFGVLILAGAIFISMVTTDRITKPIEKMKRGAVEVSRGNLSFQLDEESGDEIGRLAQAFNAMTGELELRMNEQQSLTRNMKELSAGLEFQGKVDAALRMLSRDLGAERAVFFLYDAQTGRFRATGDTSGICSGTPFKPDGGFLAESLRVGEPSITVHPADSDLYRAMSSVEEEVVSPGRPLVLLPLPVSGRLLGTILITLSADGGEIKRPKSGYLSGMASQIAVTLENARLYMVAILDPETGFYMRSFFLNRLAEECDRTVHAGGRLALLRLSIENLDSLRERSSDGAADFILQVAAVVKRICRDMYIVGQNSAGELDLLLHDGDREIALALARAILLELGGAGSGGEDSHRVRFGLALCPDDASSSEFLLDRVARSLEGNREAGLSGCEERSEDGLDREESEENDSGKVVEVCGYIFRSASMREIISDLSRVARSSVSVLLLGETGVGKEVLAEIIHRRSNRADLPFVMLNCSALPESLLESELFGHEKGAFTGAEKRKAGHFEVADKGSLFLDEVGDLTLRTQAKLLRVLQDKTIEPLGSSGNPRKVDVRIIAATNRNLTEEIRNGAFRDDLYFRLKVISIAIPPLRERKEEIPALAHRFIDEFNRENNRSVSHLSPAALDRCYRYTWPGNVRELRNVLNRAMVFVENDIIEPAHLVFEKEGEDGVFRTAAPIHPEEIFKKLNHRQGRLIHHLQVHGAITNREYMEMMGISSRTGLRDFQELIRLNLILRIGSRRAAVYKLKEPSQ
jgi:DNA-binding NtrC family response regulator/HAMP domain-containing protein/GGDEF domain-containing protein